MDLFTEPRQKRKNPYVPHYTFIDTQKDFNKHYDELMSFPHWVMDTETTGKNPHLDKVILLQLGNSEIQFLIDTREVDVKRLEERFEDENYKKVVQYGQFDYTMLLATTGIHMEGMFDCYIAEKLLGCGRQFSGFGMEAMALKYLGVEIDKDLQTSFIGHTGPFSIKQKIYAAYDCIYPEFIIEKQIERLRQEGMLEVFKIECNAIPAFSDIAYYGLMLDKDKWVANIDHQKKLFTKAENDFMNEAEKHVAVDMFGNPAINPKSPTQILQLFKTLYPGELVDAEGKEGTGEPILEKICESHDNPPIVTALLELRGCEKMIGTYGYSYINHLSPQTGRFHPNIDQIGTETGRPAGKKPNMLNIPRGAEYRIPWIVGPLRRMLNNDYGACELRIMASLSKDPVMCEGFNRGLDYHTFTAAQFIRDREQYERVFIPGKEDGKGKYGDFVYDTNGHKIPNKNYGKSIMYEKVTKKMRDVAKTINFGLAYGMGPGKLSRKLKIPLDEAREYVKSFHSTFKTLCDWLKRSQEDAVINGYAVCYLGRRRYFNVPREPSWKAEWSQNNNFDFKNPWDENLPPEWKHYHQRRAGINREGGNFPIQAGNASITKHAMYLIRKDIREMEKTRNNGNYLAHICLQVYDELLIDCPEHLAEEMALLMDKRMIEAGQLSIKEVPVAVGALIANSWVKE
jgi:DNA polymerase-1